MKVYFIGAGPGAVDLMTVRGVNLLKRCPVVIYAGSLVSRDILAYAQPAARIHNSATLTLDDLEALYVQAREAGDDVARLHSGDPTIYGALAEQIRRLRKHGIAYDVVPGVSSFTAAAAVAAAELTRPGASQTIILTRGAGRASPVRELEDMGRLAAHRATMAIFLSGDLLHDVVHTLSRHYPLHTPVLVVHKATWPQEEVLRGTLGDIAKKLPKKRFRLSTLLLIGAALNNDDTKQGTGESRLYDTAYTHLFRKAAIKP